MILLQRLLCEAASAMVAAGCLLGSFGVGPARSEEQRPNARWSSFEDPERAREDWAFFMGLFAPHCPSISDVYYRAFENAPVPEDFRKNFLFSGNDYASAEIFRVVCNPADASRPLQVVIYDWVVLSTRTTRLFDKPLFPIICPIDQRSTEMLEEARSSYRAWCEVVGSTPRKTFD